MKNKIFSLLILPICLPFLFGCNSSKQNSDTNNLTIDIYASNDIHGQIEENGDRMDIVTYGTFMKNKGQEKNTLLLDQGDTWQGSIYSNYNHGAFINDIMCEAKFSARTVGNHDFDWGVEYLIENTKRSYNDYTVPVLAANVYNYDFSSKEVGNIQQSDIGQKTITYTLDNGLKVGIVGVIGENQITSITSSYVKDLAFINHVNVIKEEATNLRNDGCDVVVASIHSGKDDVMNYGLSDYVDLVLCGHTHRLEVGVENGVYFAQFACYGEYIGHICLTYNQKEKKVVNTKIESLNKNKVSSIVNGNYDPNILSIYNRYVNECREQASQIVANNVNYYFPRGGEAVNLMCTAILDQTLKEGYDDVILSFCNTGRNNLPSYSWTYADLYSTFPFDNEVYIAEIKGTDITREIKRYSNICLNNNFDGHYQNDKRYKIACIDHLIYHTNSSRNFDYFPSFNGQPIGKLTKNYREILRDYLIDNGYSEGKLLDVNDYDSSLPQFSKGSLILD